MEEVKITDDFLKKVLPKVSEELVDEWEKTPIEKHKFSDKFNCEMETLIRKQKKKNLIKKLNKIVKYAASIIIILGVYFFSNTLVARASWDVMFKKIEVALEDASMYVYDYETDTYSFTPFEPGYIPEGYVEEIRIVDDKRVFLKYIDDNGNIIHWNQIKVVDGMLMGSDAEYDELVVKEYSGENVMMRIYDNGHIVLYYEKGNCVFNVNATNISEKDMFKLISEMKKIE